MGSGEKQVPGSGVLLAVVVLLLPATGGIVCIIYSRAALDRGTLWFLAGLLAIPAVLGMLAAITTALVASIRRRITDGLLISAWLITAVVGAGWWYSIHFIRDPFAP
jgi:hypothetical protein